MPRLMEKKDWIQTMADVGSADRIWCENADMIVTSDKTGFANSPIKVLTPAEALVCLQHR